LFVLCYLLVEFELKEVLNPIRDLSHTLFVKMGSGLSQPDFGIDIDDPERFAPIQGIKS